MLHAISKIARGLRLHFIVVSNLERHHLARRVIVLEDNDILHLARGAYNIYNLQRDDPSAKVASVSRALSRLDMEVGTILNTRCHGCLASSISFTLYCSPVLQGPQSQAFRAALQLCLHHHATHALCLSGRALAVYALQRDWVSRDGVPYGTCRSALS